jgi:hypothetical protein
VNENLSAQARILQRRALSRKRRDDLIVLASRYQTLAKTSLGVFAVRITQTKRQKELTPRILEADVELAFGRAAVTRSRFVFNRVESERNAIGFYQ